MNSANPWQNLATSKKKWRKSGQPGFWPSQFFGFLLAISQFHFVAGFTFSEGCSFSSFMPNNTRKRARGAKSTSAPTPEPAKIITKGDVHSEISTRSISSVTSGQSLANHLSNSEALILSQVHSLCFQLNQQNQDIQAQLKELQQACERMESRLSKIETAPASSSESPTKRSLSTADMVHNAIFPEYVLIYLFTFMQERDS